MRTVGTKSVITGPMQGKHSNPTGVSPRGSTSSTFAQPSIGLPAIGQALDVDGPRSWRLNGFSLSLWYFERERHVEIVRLVGQRMESLWVDIEISEGK